MAIGEGSWRDPAVLDALSRASIDALSRRPALPVGPLARRGDRSPGSPDASPAGEETAVADGPAGATAPTTAPSAPAVTDNGPALPDDSLAVLLESALQQAAVAMVLLDADHRIIWVNTALCALASRSPDDVLGTTPDFIDVSAGVAGATVVAPDPIWVPRPDPDEWREARCRRPNGSEINVLIHSGALQPVDRDAMAHATGRVAGHLLQVVDPSGCKVVDTGEGQAPLIDTLTGLPGRSLLLDRLQHALARSERSGSAVAVVRLRFDMDDVDGRRPVHTRRVFLAASRRLQAALRSTDTVAFVGDGFILVCEEIADSEVRRVADRVIEAVRAPFNIDGRPTPVSIRAGVAVGRAPQANSHRLLDEAERNLH